MIEIQEAQILWFVQKHNTVKEFHNTSTTYFIQTIKRCLNIAFDNDIWKVNLAFHTWYNISLQRVQRFNAFKFIYYKIFTS